MGVFQKTGSRTYLVSRMHPQVDTLFFPNVIFVSSFFKPLSIIWVSDWPSATSGFQAAPQLLLQHGPWCRGQQGGLKAGAKPYGFWSILKCGRMKFYQKNQKVFHVQFGVSCPYRSPSTNSPLLWKVRSDQLLPFPAPGHRVNSSDLLPHHGLRSRLRCEDGARWCDMTRLDANRVLRTRYHCSSEKVSSQSHVSFGNS